MRSRLVPALGAGSLLAGAAVAQPIIVPPVAERVLPPTTEVSILTYSGPPASVTCAEGEARLVEAEPFAPTASTRYVPPPGSPAAATSPPRPPSPTFTFAVAPDGRVTTIKRREPVVYFSGYSEETLQATLATWRFAPAARTGCALSLEPRLTPLAEARREDLLQLMTTTPTTSGEARRKIVQRARGPGDCYEGRRAIPLVTAWPEWKRIPIRAGGRAWVALDFDIDGEGRAANPRVIGSSGNTALNAEAARAVSQFRFQDTGPRKGCRHYFWRSGETLPAPPKPPGEGERPEKAECPRNLLRWSDQKPYPRAFQEREIEGWVLLRFDVAPWGEIGNIEVVRAEPAEAFVMAARQILGAAKAEPGERGYKGCIVPINFKMGDEAALIVGGSTTVDTQP